MQKQQQVAFTADKYSRPIAYRWSIAGASARWFRIGYDDAKVLVATGKAREVQYVRQGV